MKSSSADGVLFMNLILCRAWRKLKSYRMDNTKASRPTCMAYCTWLRLGPRNLQGTDDTVVSKAETRLISSSTATFTCSAQPSPVQRSTRVSIL